MSNPRVKILVAVGGLFLLFLVGYWISGWGTITLHARATPLTQVLHSIERQGRVTIVTNADPQTPVTLEVRRAPLMDTLDTLAVRLDGRLQLAQIAAPDRRTIAAGLESFREGATSGSWKVFAVGFGGGSLFPTGTVPDPRAVVWKVSAMEETHLQNFLDQGAAKKGNSTRT